MSEKNYTMAGSGDRVPGDRFPSEDSPLGLARRLLAHQSRMEIAARSMLGQARELERLVEEAYARAGWERKAHGGFGPKDAPAKLPTEAGKEKE